MQRMRVLVAGVAVAGLITGCDAGIFGTACDMVLEPALRVEVVDSVSGDGVENAAAARVVARDGEFADTASVGPLGAFLAHGRAGTYSLTVGHSAYRPWGRSGVRVREGDCGPEQVTITARLQRAP